MLRFEKRVTLPCDCSRAFQYHERRSALERLIPPWQSIRILEDDESIQNGARKRLRVKLFPSLPFGQTWEAVHEGYDPPNRFVDRQANGPMKSWVHEHRFEPIPSSGQADERCSLLDSIEFSPPFPAISEPLVGKWLQRMLEEDFRYRHDIVEKDIAFENWLGAMKPKRIAVTGASGLVGKRVCSLLDCLGHQVFPVERAPGKGTQSTPKLRWNPETGILNPLEWEGLNACIHLAGKNIASARWSPSVREQLASSRVGATRRLVESLQKLKQPPGALVSASAIGIYGDRKEEIMTENRPKGRGFLADLAQQWEEAALSYRADGGRVSLARFAMVLSEREGALKKMLPLFRWCLGGRVGSGNQWWSWVDLEDAASAVVWMAISDRAAGPYNVASPNPTTNREFTATLGRVLHRPTLFPAPAWGLRIALGDMADELLLASCRVLPSRLIDEGFPFRKPTLQACLQR